jgi:hypothetical protein
MTYHNFSVIIFSLTNGQTTMKKLSVLFLLMAFAVFGCQKSENKTTDNAASAVANQPKKAGGGATGGNPTITIIPAVAGPGSTTVIIPGTGSVPPGTPAYISTYFFKGTGNGVVTVMQQNNSTPIKLFNQKTQGNAVNTFKISPQSSQQTYTIAAVYDSACPWQPYVNVNSNGPLKPADSSFNTLAGYGQVYYYGVPNQIGFTTYGAATVVVLDSALIY